MMERQRLALLRFIARHSACVALSVGFPLFCRAQCSHLDSMLARQINTLMLQEAGGKPFAVVADSALQPLIALIPSSSGSTTVELGSLSAIVNSTNLKDTLGIKVIPAFVNAGGEVWGHGSSLTKPWYISDTVMLTMTSADRALLETNLDRYVAIERQPASTFWSDIAEPALVVLGGIAIVTLFFIIRS